MRMNVYVGVSCLQVKPINPIKEQQRTAAQDSILTCGHLLLFVDVKH